MVIDLSSWNEYIADDVPPGKIPEGLPIETMQIVTALTYKEVQVDDFPTGMRAEPESIKVRLFWRAQK